MRLKPVTYVDVPTMSGPMRTHLFQPVGERRFPGLMLFSEIYQMTGPIARTAATLAGKGYLVAVPEVYHEFEPAGTVLAYDKAGTDRGNELKITKRLEHYDDDARSLVGLLKEHEACTGQIGSVGICLGGHLAFRSSFNPEVLACACLYATDIHKRSLAAGMNDDSLDRIGEIRGELLMIWGRQDPHIPEQGRRIIYDALHKAGTGFTWHEFNGEHAFLRDEGHRFDPALSQIVHVLIDELFHRTLSR